MKNSVIAQSSISKNIADKIVFRLRLFYSEKMAM